MHRVVVACIDWICQVRQHGIISPDSACAGLLNRWSDRGGKTLCEILTVADAMQLPMADPSVDDDLPRYGWRNISTTAGRLSGTGTDTCHCMTWMEPDPHVGVRRRVHGREPPLAPMRRWRRGRSGGPSTPIGVRGSSPSRSAPRDSCPWRTLISGRPPRSGHPAGRCMPSGPWSADRSRSPRRTTRSPIGGVSGGIRFGSDIADVGVLFLDRRFVPLRPSSCLVVYQDTAESSDCLCTLPLCAFPADL